MKKPITGKELWLSSLKRLVVGFCIAGLFDFVFYQTRAPQADWPLTLRERIAIASLRNLDLASVQVGTDGDDRGRIDVFLDGENVSKDENCALAGHVPATDGERYGSRLATAILAAEEQARPVFRRATEEFVVSAAHKVAVPLDWSLGPAQIRLSTAKALLLASFGSIKVSWDDVVNAVENRCSALSLVYQKIKPSLEGKIAPGSNWRFWQVNENYQELREVRSECDSLPKNPQHPHAPVDVPDDVFKACYDELSKGDFSPKRELTGVVMKPLPVEDAIATFRGGKEVEIFSITYTQLVSDIFAFLNKGEEREILDSQNLTNYRIENGVKFQSVGNEVAKEVIFEEVDPGVVNERYPAKDINFSMLKSPFGFGIELISATGQLEPSYVTYALRTRRFSSMLGSLPKELQGLPVIRQDVISAKCFKPLIAAIVVPIGYRSPLNLGECLENR